MAAEPRAAGRRKEEGRAGRRGSARTGTPSADPGLAERRCSSSLARPREVGSRRRGHRALPRRRRARPGQARPLKRSTILRGLDRRDDLRWLLELRVKNAADDAARAILGEWAVLEKTCSRRSPDKAIASLSPPPRLDVSGRHRSPALPRLLLGWTSASERRHRARTPPSAARQAPSQDVEPAPSST